MRILGGHDYYDSALAYGQDDDVMFVREPREFPDKGCPLYAGYHKDILKRQYWRDPAVVVKDPIRGAIELDLMTVSIYVAGNHHGGIKVRERVSGAKVEVFWDYDKFESWVQSAGKELVGSKKRYKWEKSTPETDAFPDLKAFMSKVPATPTQLEWLVANRVAIAVWCDHTISYYRKGIEWHCNSAEKDWSLKEYDFPRVMDPFTLFQELSMFVGGVLPRNPNPMVEITDDKVKVAKHGFDKWSFRKHKDDK
jgi:hypothetical protein